MRFRAALLLFVCLFARGGKADNYLVLPFFNNSKNSNLNWIGESLAEAIRDALVTEGSVAVERADRRQAYDRLALRPYTLLTEASVLKIGEAVDAEQVVYGDFDLTAPREPGSKSRGSLKITARLLDLKHMKSGPEFAEIGALEDLSTLQRHLAWQTLQFVHPQTAPSEGEFVRMHPAVRVDAIEYYIRGLLANTPEEKHRLFSQAVRLDPNYSQPNFELGRLLYKKKEYKLATDRFIRVPPTDAHHREATFFLGLCRFGSGDMTGAEQAFRDVSRDVPLNEVWNNLGAAESRRNSPSAIADVRKAVDGDENDPIYRFNYAYVLWKTGNYHKAAGEFRTILDHNPGDAAAKLLLDLCQKAVGPRAGDIRTENLERLKTNYDEGAWRQLKAVLQPERK